MSWGKPGNIALLLGHGVLWIPGYGWAFLLARAVRHPGPAVARAFLKEVSGPGAGRTAIQWVGEEQLQELAPQLTAAAAQAPVNRDLFRPVRVRPGSPAGRPPNAEPIDEASRPVVAVNGQPSSFRARRLSTMRPDHVAVPSRAWESCSRERTGPVPRSAAHVGQRDPTRRRRKRYSPRQGYCAGNLLSGPKRCPAWPFEGESCCSPSVAPGPGRPCRHSPTTTAQWQPFPGRTGGPGRR